MPDFCAVTMLDFCTATTPLDVNALDTGIEDMVEDYPNFQKLWRGHRKASLSLESISVLLMAT